MVLAKMKTRWTMHSFKNIMVVENMAALKSTSSRQKMIRNVVDKTEAANLPVWIVALTYPRPSTALIGTCYGKHLLSLADQGISAHLRWIIHCLYCVQQSQVLGQAQHRFQYSCKCSARLRVESQSILQCSTTRHAQMEKPTLGSAGCLQNQSLLRIFGYLG